MSLLSCLVEEENESIQPLLYKCQILRERRIHAKFSGIKMLERRLTDKSSEICWFHLEWNINIIIAYKFISISFPVFHYTTIYNFINKLLKEKFSYKMVTLQLEKEHGIILI